ncbi:PREDICTED: uncharacterized protein LOC105458266 [Wasmannia auropunctata]|uniref:uncharacterized protein LOC105458266 n=1 Tax=Wasmannia auropunctata TaxID=64793 RepID=UPI0005EFF4BF|nr:PREDICTED: uncharacterized protein LOC105458266 [Wasmannia auropunctata]
MLQTFNRIIIQRTTGYVIKSPAGKILQRFEMSSFQTKLVLVIHNEANGGTNRLYNDAVYIMSTLYKDHSPILQQYYYQYPIIMTSRHDDAVKHRPALRCTRSAIVCHVLGARCFTTQIKLEQIFLYHRLNRKEIVDF